jgi:hypothetical protein
VSAGQAVTVAASEPEARSTWSYTKDDVTLLMSEDARRRHFGERLIPSSVPKRRREPASVTPSEAGLVPCSRTRRGWHHRPAGYRAHRHGPIAAVLTGGAIGAAGGGLLGALIGYGIPEDQARRYETGIREGNIVMGVTPRSGGDAEPAAARLTVRRDAHSDRISK